MSRLKPARSADTVARLARTPEADISGFAATAADLVLDVPPTSALVNVRGYPAGSRRPAPTARLPPWDILHHAKPTGRQPSRSPRAPWPTLTSSFLRTTR